MQHPCRFVVFRLIIIISLAFGVCLAVKSDPAWAGSGVLAGWPSQSWTASTGVPINAGTALLSTTTSGGTSGPFYTSTGAPTGESNVFISDGWASGSGTKCWKVAFKSTGFQSLTVSSQQMSTNLGFSTWNGPRDFKLQYSLNNSTWTDVPGGALTLGSNWSAGGKLTNLSLPAALNNQPNAYLRWIMTSNTSVTPAYPTTDSAAQSLISGIYINGTETPAAPTDLLLSGSTLSNSDPVGTLVGNLSAVDSNSLDTWTYSLVSGTGSTNNASFIVTGTQLFNTAVLASGSYNIRANVYDGTYNFAKPFTITVTAYPGISGGNTTYNDYITNVTFAGINHSSGNDNGYADYTAFAATVSPGTSPNLSSTINLGDVAYPAVVVAWIDWNQNFSFNDPGEKYVIGTNLNVLGANTASAAIAVPVTATLGNTRMRIVSNADNGTNQPPNSGPGVYYGDAEDYTIQVVTCTSAGSTAWSSSSTWTCGHVPNGSEPVTIAAGHTVSLSGNVTQTGPIVLNGDINTGVNILTLGASATLTGTGDISGTVRRSSPATGSALFFNNLSTTFNFTTAPTQLDVKLTKSAHPNADAAGGGALMLPRYYTLTPTGSVNATVCLGYKDSELGAITEANLRLCRWTGSAWSCPARAAGSSTTTNMVCAANVTQFSDWVLGAVGPTAITLRDMTAQSSAIISMLPLAILVLAVIVGALLITRRRRHMI